MNNIDKVKQLIDDADIFAVIAAKKEDDQILNTTGGWKAKNFNDLENLLCSFVASIIQETGVILARRIVINAVNKACQNYQEVHEVK